MSAVDRDELLDVLLDHVMVPDPTGRPWWVCLDSTQRCQWWAPRGTSPDPEEAERVNWGARVDHAHHLADTLIDDGLIDVMGPAELAEGAEPMEVTW